jgi:hypothetical protein
VSLDKLSKSDVSVGHRPRLADADLELIRRVAHTLDDLLSHGRSAERRRGVVDGYTPTPKEIDRTRGFRRNAGAPFNTSAAA